MTTVRAVNPVTGGIITSGTQFLTDQAAIAQTIQTRLKLFYGEYFRNIEEGTPWFQAIMVKGATVSSKNAFIRNIIIQTEGVEELLRYNSDFDIDNRTLSVSAEVLTTFGLQQLELQQGLTPLSQVGVSLG